MAAFAQQLATVMFEVPNGADDPTPDFTIC